MFIEEYRPMIREDYSDPVGNYNSMKRWMMSVIDTKKFKPSFKTALLHGKSGTGKTTLVKMLCNELDVELVVKNSSEEFKKEQLFETWKESSVNSLEKQKIILLDEADGISESIQEKLLPLLKSARVPIILVANDLYRMIAQIRYSTFKLEFRPPTSNQIFKTLVRVSERSGIKTSQKRLTQISERAHNYRDAINILELTKDMPDGMIDIFTTPYSEFTTIELIQEILCGKDPPIGVEPAILTPWLYENAEDKSVVESIDIQLSRALPTDFRTWYYAYKLINLTRAKRGWTGFVQFPHKFSQKKKKKDSKGTK